MLPRSLWLLLVNMTLLSQTHQPEAVALAELRVSRAQKQQYREAIQSYQRALAIDPTLPGLYLNLGLAWFKLGNFREAIAFLNREYSREPSVQVASLLAMSYFGLQQYPEAAERLKPPGGGAARKYGVIVSAGEVLSVVRAEQRRDGDLSLAAAARSKFGRGPHAVGRGAGWKLQDGRGHGGIRGGG